MGLLPLLCFQLLRLLPLRWLPSASRYQDKGFAAPSSSSTPSGFPSASAFERSTWGCAEAPTSMQLRALGCATAFRWAHGAGHPLAEAGAHPELATRQKSPQKRTCGRPHKLGYSRRPPGRGLTSPQHSWPWVAAPQHSWPRVTSPQHSWPRMTAPQHSWPQMTASQHSWLQMTLAAWSWPRMTSPQLLQTSPLPQQLTQLRAA